MNYPSINVSEINVGGVGSIYTNNGLIEISNFAGGGGGGTGPDGNTGPVGQTGPRGETGPAGPGGGGSLTIRSGMVNVPSGDTGTTSRSIPTDPLILPVFADNANVETLLNLTTYFDTNTNVITINTSVSLNFLAGSSLAEYIYFQASCWDNITGSGESLTSTTRMNIATRTVNVTSNDRLIAPINIVLTKDTNFNSSHPYLQIYLSKTNNSGSFNPALASDTVPVTILSL